MINTQYNKAIVIFIFISLASIAPAETITGKVVAVSDGDTITVLDSNKRQVKVRLAQIDAPEKKQNYGQASKQALSGLVFGRQVTVDVETIDRYKRTVGKVLVSGVDANLRQVQSGMAWVYRQYAKDQAYYAAENSARSANLGLWSQSEPTPPWDYRKQRKQRKYSLPGLISSYLPKATPPTTSDRQKPP